MSNIVIGAKYQAVLERCDADISSKVRKVGAKDAKGFRWVLE